MKYYFAYYEAIFSSGSVDYFFLKKCAVAVRCVVPDSVKWTDGLVDLHFKSSRRVYLISQGNLIIALIKYTFLGRALFNRKKLTVL